MGAIKTNYPQPFIVMKSGASLKGSGERYGDDYCVVHSLDGHVSIDGSTRKAHVIETHEEVDFTEYAFRNLLKTFHMHAAYENRYGVVYEMDGEPFKQRHEDLKAELAKECIRREHEDRMHRNEICRSWREKQKTKADSTMNELGLSDEIRKRLATIGAITM